MDDERRAAVEQLHRDIENGRAGEVADFLLEHLAVYGPEGIDVQALAIRVSERQEQE